MKTLFPLMAALAFYLMSGTAYALPDCSNVDSASRLAGCHGLPDFDVEVILNEDDRGYVFTRDHIQLEPRNDDKKSDESG